LGRWGLRFIWLSRQLGTFDGNFLLLASLIVAAAFGLYLKYLIASALEAPVAKKRSVAKAESKAA